jgi:hypothetical protein
MKKYNFKDIYGNHHKGGDPSTISNISSDPNISSDSILSNLHKENIYEEDSKNKTTINRNSTNNKTNNLFLNKIDYESSDESNIDEEIKMENIHKYTSIDEIPEFLDTVKNHYLNLRLNLDRNEISRLITKTLNVALLGYITQENEIFDLFMGSYEDIKKKVKIIIKKIREFNKKCKFEYWVDLDKIVYILWFKEIKFVRNIIVDISQNLEYQLNIVHINSYLIDKLYNDPKYTKYYVKILIMLIEKDNGTFLSNDKLKNFFSTDKIYKMYDMIKAVLYCDSDLMDFIEKCKNIKLEKEKENNDQNRIDNFNDIEEIENQFRREKKKLLTSPEKRNLNIDTLFKENQKNNKDEEISSIKDIIVDLDDDTWNAFNLFIYKKFNFDIVRYIEQTNKIIQEPLSKLRLDYFDDLEVPFTVRINPGQNDDQGTILQGGNSIYLKKYLKYKEKYLKLKIGESFGLIKNN